MLRAVLALMVQYHPHCALAQAQQQVGFATGALAGARLLTRLARPASGSTVLRLMHAAPLPRTGRPHVIGIDDWAWRRGRRWGTLVVDLERHQAVDLLPDRDSATCAAWLRTRTGLAIVARDRSTGSARAAPHTLQVADRGHLRLNARQMLERWLVGAHSRLCKLPIPRGSAGAITPSREAVRTKPPRARRESDRAEHPRSLAGPS